MPKADFERFIAESMAFVEEASKQTSSPIFERPTSILDSGRRDVKGMVASKSVVGADGTMPSRVLTMLAEMIGTQFVSLRHSLKVYILRSGALDIEKCLNYSKPEYSFDICLSDCSTYKTFDLTRDLNTINSNQQRLFRCTLCIRLLPHNS